MSDDYDRFHAAGFNVAEWLLAEHRQEDFATACRSIHFVGTRLLKQLQNWPEGHPFPIDDEFRDSLELAAQMIEAININQTLVSGVHGAAPLSLPSVS
jgi:hypothetical protein